MSASRSLTDNLDPNAKSAFARRTLPGIACLLAAALLAAAVAVIQIASTIDSDALVRERFLTGKAFEAHQRGMSRHVADNAFWGDAYANLSSRVNLNWAYEQENLGPSLYQDFGYDAVFVIDPDGKTTYSVIRGELLQVDAQQWLKNGLKTLLIVRWHTHRRRPSGHGDCCSDDHRRQRYRRATRPCLGIGLR
jgi:sensor domain CHASE-containing protein